MSAVTTTNESQGLFYPELRLKDCCIIRIFRLFLEIVTSPATTLSLRVGYTQRNAWGKFYTTTLLLVMLHEAE